MVRGDEADKDSARTPRRRMAGRVALAGGGLLLAGALGLWAERRPIAARVIDRELARRGVVARYRVEAIGLGRDRLVDVVVGDPRAPDLVADWVEADTRIGWDGATVTGIRAGHVRARARWIGGRLSLGSVDRLLPASTGKAFRLPALDLDVGEARVRLELPQGLVMLHVAGRGRVDGGFRGTVAASGARLATAGCVARDMTAGLRVSVDRARPRLQGPVRAGALTCGGVSAVAAASDVDVTLGPALDRWDGRARVAVAAVAHPAARVAGFAGTVDFGGDREGTRGALDLTAARFESMEASGGALALYGSFLVDRNGAALGSGSRARVSARDVRIAPARLSALDRWYGFGTGTPLAPLLRRWTGAARAAGERFDLAASFTASAGGGATRVAVADAQGLAATGARVRWTGETGFDLTHAMLAPTAGTLAVGGGGLPVAKVRLDAPDPGIALTGIATVRPDAASGATLALAPVRFAVQSDGRARVVTAATVSGPLANGWVDALTVPVDARWSGGALTLNPDCGSWSAARVSVAGLFLVAPRATICPVDGALLRVAGDKVSGGARLANLALAGSIGASPLTLTASDTVLRLGERDLAARDVMVRLGAAGHVTRLNVGNLDGTLHGGGVAGTFGGGGGQIGAVPLLLSNAAGRWTLAGGALDVTGALTVSDTAAQARFHSLPARDVTLRLANNRLDAHGTLIAPTGARTVAEVAITHDLTRGVGDATLKVPGLVFDKTLQPDALTPVTFGVIADVAGTVTGKGRIAWDGAGVTSSGTFRTAGTDLAAAFGPVSGLAGEIRFTDLLALRSAPDQRVTVRQINPGIPVTDGVIRFETLSGTSLRVAGGEWPFAGGMLTLRPTLLDYATPQPHALTFALQGVDARQFLAQFDFKNLDATGTFDGVLPMVFDDSGGRIERGHLGVREGGGTIAYVGELSRKRLGFWGDLAFEALKSLRYRNLVVTMNGPLAGEMVTQLRFAGVGQGVGAKSNFLIRRLERLPFVFNVRITAPFRGLLDSAQSFYDPGRLIERNLPALLEQQRAATAVQPPASENKP